MKQERSSNLEMKQTNKINPQTLQKERKKN
jgi:hypothetical protein